MIAALVALVSFCIWHACRAGSDVDWYSPYRENTGVNLHYGIYLDITVWPVDGRVYMDTSDRLEVEEQFNWNKKWSYIRLNRNTIIWSEYNSMRNSRGGVFRYNQHVCTYSDWFGVVAVTFITWRDGISSCSISHSFSRYFYAYRTWPLSRKVDSLPDSHLS